MKTGGSFVNAAAMTALLSTATLPQFAHAGQRTPGQKPDLGRGAVPATQTSTPERNVQFSANAWANDDRITKGYSNTVHRFLISHPSAESLLVAQCVTQAEVLAIGTLSAVYTLDPFSGKKVAVDRMRPIGEYLSEYTISESWGKNAKVGLVGKNTLVLTSFVDPRIEYHAEGDVIGTTGQRHGEVGDCVLVMAKSRDNQLWGRFVKWQLP